MTRRHKILLGILLLPVALYAAYKWKYPTISWNQRMTVAVEVNGEIVSGSSVTRVKYVFYPKTITEAGRWSSHLKGEAVYIDVNGRPLFALLRSENSVDYLKLVAQDMFRRELPRDLDIQIALQRLPGEFGSREIPRERYPMLVTFTDINDPKSVQLVNPDDLAATFGAGVSLKRITLEITGDEVTEKIVEVLQWLPGRRSVTGYLGGWPEDPTELFLNGSEFKKGNL